MTDETARCNERTIVFVSHVTPQDNDFVLWLCARLASAGYEVWSDVTKLIGGEVFWRDIEDAIRNHTARFLSVLTPAAPHKVGFMNELSVAAAIESTGKHGDFIIPLRLGAISFSDFPIQIHNKNAIDFLSNWPTGFAKLLRKLDKDAVPKQDASAATRALSEWANQHLDMARGVVRNPEPVVSNWIPIEGLPETIRVSAFSLTPQSIGLLQEQWPCRLVGWHLISFAKAEDFDIPADIPHPRREAEVDTTAFLTSGLSALPRLSYQDRSNILVDLLRQAWDLKARSCGLRPFGLANQQQCWYWDKSEKGIERVHFEDQVGTSGHRALTGESRKLKTYWHYAVEAAPAPIGQNARFALLSHVVFTSDGTTPVWSAQQTHRLRRRFCKSWWQDRWRDLMSAYLQKLANGEDTFVLPAAPGRNVTVSAKPLTSICPVSSVAAATAPPSASVEDVDLLYDEEDVEEDEMDETDVDGTVPVE